MASMAAYKALVHHMIANAPDPNEELPISNRPETLYGSVIPFIILSWTAIGMRMFVRLRVMRDPGWDDYLVILAGCLNTAAASFVLYTIKHGLGHHYLYIGQKNMAVYQKFFYLANACYITEAALIKMSLLFQYLRIFKSGTMRWICLVMLGLVTIWGLAYGFLAWFPCFPVKAYWRRAEFPNAKCYGFGFDYFHIDDFVALFESHTALNMVFDIAIFTTPMVLFTRSQLRMSSLLSLAGIFLIGGVVVMISVWRLHSIILNRAATLPYIDFTWFAPITLILSCLEVNLAIVCASMPVFWPQIEKPFSAIFVTHEVHITEHRRLDDHYELEDGKASTTRNGSVKSDGGRSTEGLTRKMSEDQRGVNRQTSSGGKKEARVSGHYRDPYNIAQIDPFGAEAATVGLGVETNVDSNAEKPKWRM
ncbi:hypothetical protein CC80DRAFT_294371 [Byssothecium circinans]|uniref:Rhodopsin domain-containing protein n=1 Tax=Byssothecium circinans TaxID=147558 RepID=A0A6A5U8Z6_9PLEO|nr:hypothetical protein CC80DRAFT_294371 [Byssothecium circinans]